MLCSCQPVSARPGEMCICAFPEQNLFFIFIFPLGSTSHWLRALHFSSYQLQEFLLLFSLSFRLIWKQNTIEKGTQVPFSQFIVFPKYTQAVPNIKQFICTAIPHIVMMTSTLIFGCFHGVQLVMLVVFKKRTDVVLQQQHFNLEINKTFLS